MFYWCEVNFEGTIDAKETISGVTLVATFISAGVSAGASGFMVVNGKIRKIGPRGPAFFKLTEAVKELSAGRKITRKSAKRSPSQ